MKKLIALLLALMMVASCALSLAEVDPNRRTITIGLWWDIYYDSTHETLEDDPSYSGTEADELRFNVVKEIEDKYNVNIEFVNLTYTGVQDSINTSIMAGTPDCDVYLVELGWGIPAAMKGYFTDLHTILPEDSDIFTRKTVLSGTSVAGGNEVYFFSPIGMNNTYPLMFNLQLLEDANLEDPRDLYERGEWTWDKFVEYCQALTKDTDGDGVNDQYGFCGYVNDVINNITLSNGCTIASGETEQFSSEAVGECFQLVQDLYTKYNVCVPYDENSDSASDSMRVAFMKGNVGFSVGAVWILNGQGAYSPTSDATLEFDTIFVPWPVGPHGDKDTNALMQVGSGNSYYAIPVGVEDPELVYNVFYDYQNYFHDDTSIRDDEETLWWWISETGKEEEYQRANFDVQLLCLTRPQVDLYEALGVSVDWLPLLKGEVTVAQFQETYRQQYQDGLDILFGK